MIKRWSKMSKNTICLCSCMRMYRACKSSLYSCICILNSYVCSLHSCICVRVLQFPRTHDLTCVRMQHPYIGIHRPACAPYLTILSLLHLFSHLTIIPMLSFHPFCKSCLHSQVRGALTMLYHGIGP